VLVKGGREILSFGPSKTKQIQTDSAKSLGFIWIPLVESGLFNGLHRIQIKESGSYSARRWRSLHIVQLSVSRHGRA
jgi:hypothetical protein